VRGINGGQHGVTDLGGEERESLQINETGVHLNVSAGKTRTQKKGRPTRRNGRVNNDRTDRPKNHYAASRQKSTGGTRQGEAPQACNLSGLE